MWSDTPSPFEAWRTENLKGMAVSREVLELIAKAFEGGQLAKQTEKQDPVAVVTGTYAGRFVVRPINHAMVLPAGMALYSAPPKREWVGFTAADFEEFDHWAEFKEAGSERVPMAKILLRASFILQRRNT